MLHAVNEQVDAALLEGDAGSSIRNLVATYAEDAEILGAIESRVNGAGYAAAFSDDLDRAYDILELATRLFPGSANAWDSFAEIVLMRGDRDRAIECYEKALEVDPTFSNAANQLEKIRSEDGSRR